MLCPACKFEVPDEDLFCESCGTKLPEATDDTLEQDAVPLCACGAAAGEVDEDGYCMQCGKRLLRPASDHMEQEISPDFAAVSDRGVRHDKNEDRFALLQTERGAVLLVCDGVSTTETPEATSALVANVIARELCKALHTEEPGYVETSLRRSFEKAREELRGAMPREGNEAPATTLIAAVVGQEEITVAWAGDSRAYWIDGEGARLLTRDHSWWRMVVDAGELTEAEASASPQAHAITRWIGSDGASEAEEVITHRVTSRGLLLLCTDGLWNHVPDSASLASLVSEAGARTDHALGIARELVSYANSQGGQDNVTVAVLRCGPLPGDPNVTKGL